MLRSLVGSEMCIRDSDDLGRMVAASVFISKDTGWPNDESGILAARDQPRSGPTVPKNPRAVTSESVQEGDGGRGPVGSVLAIILAGLELKKGLTELYI